MDEEAGYTEMTELSTFPKHTSQVFLIQGDDTVSETYIAMGEFSKRESPIGVPNCPKPNTPKGQCQNGPITYKKASKEEDTNCLQYENVSVPNTTLARSDASHTRAIQENNLTLCKRLEISRRKMRCFEFTCYAVGAVYKEAEQNALIEAISSFFAIGILAAGFIFLDGCKACTLIPVMLVCSGIMDSIASIISLGIIFKNNNRKCLCWRDATRAIRSLMLVVHAYGLVLVYEVMHPEETDKSSAKYCNAYLYWLGFVYFHTFVLTSVATLVAMIIVPFFYLFKKNKYVFNQNIDVE
ncbi:uncharacterized protein [Parasteatoda tepidariorum]|uniref:uncharacterized protein isoform X2 n=1 Tax=Parasteatoda tepidariorum TaxID=114398 RepID=UPI0039BD4B26